MRGPGRRAAGHAGRAAVQPLAARPGPAYERHRDAPDADFEEAGPASAEEDLERYRAECRAVDAALAGAALDETFTFREQTMSVRWMWQHLVEEYARHNGHADLIREVIDGSAGL
jgi:hypothetical protein